MNLHLIKYLSLSALCAAATGCVNYDTATQQEVYFYSEDTPAVTVSLNGEVVGETSCSTLLDRSNSYSVLFTKEGYKPATYDLIPFEDPDSGVIGFIDEVYCPELEPETEEAPAETVVPTEPVPPAVDTEDPAEQPVSEDVAEPAEPAEPADDVTPPEEEPAETPVAEEPVKEEPTEQPKPEVVPEPEDDEPVQVRTMTELQAELAELKRLRKLNLISAEEFEKRTNALIEEVSRTY